MANKQSPEQSKYQIIYSDPPWPQQKGNIRRCRPNQGKVLDYPTETVERCFTLQDCFLGNAAEHHNVFMWSIDRFLIVTEQEMAKRGYKLHARFIWDKGNGIAPAFTVRFSHEYLLWFYKPGKMLKPCVGTRGKYTTVFREAATYHSHKPEYVYEMLEEMFPNTAKIELFARNTREGWDAWGNQIAKPTGDGYHEFNNCGLITQIQGKERSENER